MEAEKELIQLEEVNDYPQAYKVQEKSDLDLRFDDYYQKFIATNKTSMILEFCLLITSTLALTGLKALEAFNIEPLIMFYLIFTFISIKAYMAYYYLSLKLKIPKKFIEKCFKEGELTGTIPEITLKEARKFKKEQDEINKGFKNGHTT